MLTTENDTLLTSGEAAKRAQITPRHVGLLVRQGILQAHRMGDRWLISATSLQNFITNRPRRGRPVIRKAS